MGVEIRKTRLYVKLVLIVLVVLFAAVVLCNNRNNAATVWFFKDYQNVNVLKLMLLTAVASIVSFWVLSTIFRVWNEWREVSKQIVQQERERQFAERSKALDEREKRLSEGGDGGGDEIS